MQKVLIVSKLFAPDNTIGAVRPTKIGKFLQKKGYIVDVVTCQDSIYEVDDLLKNDLRYFNKVYKIRSKIKASKPRYGFKEGNLKFSSKRKTPNIENVTFKNTKIYRGFKNHIKYILNLINEYYYFMQFKKEDIDLNDYSYLFTSYSTHGNHFIGRYIKNKNNSIKWVADFRDPVYQDTVPLLFKSYAKMFAGKYCFQSDAITAVSKGVYSNLYLKDYRGTFEVLSNGYDLEDLEEIHESGVHYCDDIFRLVYTGQLYDGRRDVSILFNALQDLIVDGAIDKDKIEFHYAGNSIEILRKQAEKYDLDGIIVDHGYVARRQSLNLQKKGDLLVLATWNNINEQGVLTGKFFEYLMLHKPIVAVVNGNQRNSLLKEIINDLEVGVTYEEINNLNDYAAMKVFLLKIYKQVMYLEKVEFNIKEDKVEYYDFKSITDRLINIYAKL
jgi:hypothetical protein